MSSRRIANTLSGILALGATALAQAQQQPSPQQTPPPAMPAPPDVQITTTELAPGIYVLFGRGGNVGLTVGADGAAIIDDQFADMAPKIRAAVAMLSDRPVKFVINTHLHGDHTGGNDAFGRRARSSSPRRTCASGWARRRSILRRISRSPRAPARRCRW
jgi:glyoxylase-like metal-dependent hydrolase (beta-lactamase superfamily II)